MGTAEDVERGAVVVALVDVHLAQVDVDTRRSSVQKEWKLESIPQMKINAAFVTGGQICEGWEYLKQQCLPCQQH